MKCLSTRTTSDGFKRRRYEMPSGQRVTTLEVPITVWAAINRQGRGSDRAAAWSRARARDNLRLRALDHMNLGWKAEASAHDLGVPVRTIYRWRKGAA